MKINCVITDDEPIAREIIEDYVKMLPDLTLIASCSNAVETYAALRSHKVDLLFLDIQMPEINGLELMRSLKNPPAVIFTTAYPSFAIDGFDLDAVDYLLKPFSMERFLKAIDKTYQRLNPGRHDVAVTKGVEKFLFIKSDVSLVRMDFDKILYIEGMENYVKIFCEGRMILSLTTMKAIAAELPPENFLRIHRSYIVNLDKVDHVKDLCFNIKDKSLQIGKSYKKAVQNILFNRYKKIIR
jgi:DNA-binding LytR/AlgR family response regulator